MSTDIKKVILDGAEQHADLADVLRESSPADLGFSHVQSVALVAPLQLEIIVCLDDVTVWSTEAHELSVVGAFERNIGIPWVVSLTDLMVIVEMLQGAQLAQYLVRRQRMERDGRVSANDELDWLGHYLKEGLHFDGVFSGETVPSKYRLLSYTEQFDEWYFYEAGFRTIETERPSQWMPPNLNRLIGRLESVRPQGWILVALCMLDGDYKSRGMWEKMVTHAYRRAVRVGDSDVSQMLSNGVAVTLLQDSRRPVYEVRKTARGYATAKLAEVTEAVHWLVIYEGRERKLEVFVGGDGGAGHLALMLVDPAVSQ